METHPFRALDAIRMRITCESRREFTRVNRFGRNRSTLAESTEGELKGKLRVDGEYGAQRGAGKAGRRK
jgi:hypothetical protein